MEEQFAKLLAAIREHAGAGVPCISLKKFREACGASKLSWDTQEELLAYLKENGVQFLPDDAPVEEVQPEPNLRDVFEDPESGTPLDAIIRLDFCGEEHKENFFFLLKHMGETTRQVLHLKMEGLSEQEIASRLEISQEQVYLQEKKLTDRFRTMISRRGHIHHFRNPYADPNEPDTFHFDYRITELEEAENNADPEFYAAAKDFNYRLEHIRMHPETMEKVDALLEEVIRRECLRADAKARFDYYMEGTILEEVRAVYRRKAQGLSAEETARQLNISVERVHEREMHILKKFQGHLRETARSASWEYRRKKNRLRYMRELQKEAESQD